MRIDIAEAAKYIHTTINTGSIRHHLIIGFGETLWDILPTGKQLGGAPANFSFFASQFGNTSYAVSALGRDALGDETIDALQQRGLHYLMPRIDYPTGTVEVTLDVNGIPSYEIRQDVAWDHIPFTPELEDLARRCDAVCWGSLAQRSSTSRRTIRQFIERTADNCLRIFDINLRQHFYSREIIEDSLQLCHILKINDEEIQIIARMFGYEGLSMEEVGQTLLNKYSLNYLALTCGAIGSYVFSADETSYLETPRVKVVDTVGAGDSFTGTFCSAILDGTPLRKAHQRAVEVSAYVCTQAGAMPSLPDHLRSF